MSLLLCVFPYVGCFAFVALSETNLVKFLSGTCSVCKRRNLFLVIRVEKQSRTKNEKER